MSHCIIDKYGIKNWLNDKGKLHRDDGPALEYTDGSKCWYQNGKLHRLDGPAQIFPTSFDHLIYNNYWYQNGMLHRTDGPAIEFSNGHKEWYYLDRRILCKSQKHFIKLIKLINFW